MSIKSFIPLTAEFSKRHFRKYLARKVRGHDALLAVKWSDGKITYLAADYRPESEEYIAENGLPFKMAGKGANAGYVGNVPVYRCLASIQSPIDDTAAVAMNKEDTGEFKRVEGDDAVVEVERVDDAEAAGAAPAARSDGGGTVNHRYDLKPPDGAAGWVYDAVTAAEYAPYALRPQDIKDAEERGKQSERVDEEGWGNIIYFGAGFVFALGFALLYGAVMGGGSPVSLPGMIAPVLQTFAPLLGVA